MRITGSVVLCCIVMAGCGGHSLDVGSNDGGVVAEAALMPTLPLGPAPDAGDTQQVWIGHLTKNQFPDGSNTLTMTIDFAPGGLVTGSIVLGDGPLLAPATDPNVGYPPGNLGAVTLVEGFPYTIQNGVLTASHLTLQISEYEVWTQWCALQTSYPVPSCSCPDAGDSGQYDCLPRHTFDPRATWSSGPGGCAYGSSDGAVMPIDCGKLNLCGGAPVTVCECSATGCSVASSRSPSASLDLALAGTQANGALSGSFGDYPVQFIRSQ